MLRLPGIAFGALTILIGFIAAPIVKPTQAIAAAPKCKLTTNRHVACTDKLKTKSNQKAGIFDATIPIKGVAGESGARRKPGLRAK